MSQSATASDKAVGLGLLFGLLAVGGAMVMFVLSTEQVLAGWGFALAIVAGALAIGAIHVFS